MTDFIDHPLLLLLIAIVSYPIYRGLGLMFFDSKEGFFEAMRYWLTPDVWSLFNGRIREDWEAELKLFLFLILCICFVAAAYMVCVRYLF